MRKILKVDSPQGIEATAKWQEIYNRLLLTNGYDGSAERLNENYNFWKRLETLARECSCGEQYRDEVVTSKRGYPSGYKVRDINEQIDIIGESFELSPIYAKNFIKKLPKHPPFEKAEGWFAFAKSESVVKNLSEFSISQIQVEAMKIILRYLNLCEDCRGYTVLEERFRQNRKTLHFLSRIKEEQEGDIIIIPAQHGLLHRGKSNSRARETLLENEFGLGSFHVGCMRMSHPERYEEDCLNVNCPGDKIALFDKSNYRDAITWYYSREKNIRCSIYKDTANEYSAPVTGFYFPTSC